MPPRSRAPAPPIAEHPADRAVRTRDPVLLPPEQRATYQAVDGAFAAYSAGRDEEARTLIAAVGLTSPFLDWRVLLRGLMIYAGGDPARAIENFARLDPQRLPARLAAPLRAALEPGTPVPDKFAPAVKALLGDALTDNLLTLRKSLGGGRGLGGAFKILPAIVPTLKLRSPDAAQELTRLMYHAVRNQGKPDDLPKLNNLFGPYPDDPAFHRLNALAFEQDEAVQEAKRHWLAYEVWLGKNPAGWPRDLATRARAMAITRVARLTAAVEELYELINPIDPVPQWRRAIELAPGWEPAALDLLNYFLVRNKLTEAEAVARAHLDHKPGAVPFLDALARVLAGTGRPAEALGVRKRQLEAGPLNAVVRRQTARAHLSAARGALIDGDPRAGAGIDRRVGGSSRRSRWRRGSSPCRASPSRK